MASLPTLGEYYIKYIQPLNKRFRRWTPGSSSTVVCPIHEDTDPSMGFFMAKGGTEKFHCFGCGAAGDIVTMHRRIQYIYHRKRMTLEEAEEDLFKLYGIPLVKETKSEKTRSRREELEAIVDTLSSNPSNILVEMLSGGIPERTDLASAHLQMVIQKAQEKEEN